MIKKDKIPMICNIISVLLNAVFMIIPAAVIFVVGYIVKKKWRK